MPEETPVPVTLVGLSSTMWEYLDKAEEAYRLAAFAAMSSVFVLVFLLTALLVAAALRRSA